MTPLEATLAALLALPTYKEDRGPEHVERRTILLNAVATYVTELKPPAGVGAKDWRALVIAVGAAETHYSLRLVWDANCKPHECDRGKARTAWQMHENDHTRPVWEELGMGFISLGLQTRTADAMLKRAYYRCEKEHPAGDWRQQTILAYAGRGCSDKTIAPWKGMSLRLDYWQRARRAMG